MFNIVVIASGNGSNFQAVIDAIDSGLINARIIKLISDNERANALNRARSSGIETVIINGKDSNFYPILNDILLSINPDLIVLDGFMKIMPDYIVNEFLYKMINIHPSLLPAFGGRGFYGIKVHRSVIRSGARFSGCTIHFVTSDVDNGPIIEQRVVEVNDDDDEYTLSEKIHEEEHRALVSSIALLISGRYRISGKRVLRLY
ncbi:phosphoribosylglycinamide formyltransferase [Picrophilus oshimae]|uniref:phosphoribosylglycinamide formyltransferase 1 n=1 Tax=Picrophilus torridus (strain ATCC 700027 / DSM 9790 / JCM 10055 / NBRC 100828 / KAW 2/3) TaxID=1122961 RepID=A0A8G2L7W7_PICTO|nr:phosphoribosylglycinamide formyltransferase [Picrophilus oshimae]SMD30734.1 formyltetrahydrofolate-dependent phosphoribosylglycinamide formyltransferase [Picrophilus oshimae DSM 9789]